MKITIINFSGRLDGNCCGVAGCIKQALPAGSDIILKQMHDLDITPCGKCGYECFRKGGRCPYIGDDVYGIYDSVITSEKSFYIVPNYCDYPSSYFFIFNERSQCFFQNRGNLLSKYLQASKQFIVVSNTDKANFTKAFSYHISERQEPDILFLAAKAFSKVSINGDLMDSPQAKVEVERFVHKA